MDKYSYVYLRLYLCGSAATFRRLSEKVGHIVTEGQIISNINNIQIATIGFRTWSLSSLVDLLRISCTYTIIEHGDLKSFKIPSIHEPQSGRSWFSTTKGISQVPFKDPTNNQPTIVIRSSAARISETKSSYSAPSRANFVYG